MTGSALLGNGADGIAYVKSASGVFSYSSYSSGTTFGNSLQSLARRYLSFDGSSGFSGYTSSAGSHSHSMSLNNTGSNAAHNNISRRCSMS